ncbi:hypothetical protein K0A97_00840 [Patescibacteria group bacterium]|nr:hypothetical protein [Patescibacteria group bacterium]
MTSEIIERKGRGHPDTIADNLAEVLGKKLKNQYLKEYGKIQHYNVDKVLASCGKVDYDKKEMISPVKIVFSGNATKTEEIEDLLKKTVNEVLEIEINRGLKYEVFNHIAEGSPDLSDNFNKNLCNDTSFSVGHPYTEAEKKVLEISHFLEKEALDSKEIGTDHKVMYINGKIFIALALICETRRRYDELKKSFEISLRKKYENENIFINTGDNEKTCFNTVTGTSLEQGDAGMTGRGNRYNDLITPTKPMTMEAYCGKNDVTHIGRTYQKLAQELATKEGKSILLVNHIGNDIEDYEKFYLD